MHVSANNIIRFPAVQAAPARAAAAREQPATVVDFPAREQQTVDVPVQDHGKIFAAHRIVERIASQLENTATL